MTPLTPLFLHFPPWHPRNGQRPSNATTLDVRNAFAMAGKQFTAPTTCALGNNCPISNWQITLAFWNSYWCPLPKTRPNNFFPKCYRRIPIQIERIDRNFINTWMSGVRILLMTTPPWINLHLHHYHLPRRSCANVSNVEFAKNTLKREPTPTPKPTKKFAKR